MLQAQWNFDDDCPVILEADETMLQSPSKRQRRNANDQKDDSAEDRIDDDVLSTSNDIASVGKSLVNLLRDQQKIMTAYLNSTSQDTQTAAAAYCTGSKDCKCELTRSELAAPPDSLKMNDACLVCKHKRAYHPK